MSLMTSENGKKVRYFKLGDSLNREEKEALKNGGHMVWRDPVHAYRVHLGNFELRQDRDILACYTGEKRPPRKGEWYLSGAVITAYRAPNDLTTAYHIARPVVVESKTVTNRRALQVL